jgi:thymidylate kinase
MPGLFVTLEGIDRSGKTTQARLPGEALGDARRRGARARRTAVGERVRELLKDPRSRSTSAPRRCCSPPPRASSCPR